MQAMQWDASYASYAMRCKLYKLMQVMQLMQWDASWCKLYNWCKLRQIIQVMQVMQVDAMQFKQLFKQLFK